jgi:hypothetical protein
VEKMKDGWHKIQGYEVYVENNKVIRGLKENGTLPAYPYKTAKDGGWDNAAGVSVSTFSKGVADGRYILN